MSEFVPSSRVLLGQSAGSVDDVLRLLADKAVELGLSADAAGVYDAFKAREAEGTTGMMGGFAIPHAKSDAITESGIIVVKFSEGVEWPSMDNEPVTCAIADHAPAAALQDRGPSHGRGVPHQGPGNLRRREDRRARERGSQPGVGRRLCRSLQNIALCGGRGLGLVPLIVEHRVLLAPVAKPCVVR